MMQGLNTRSINKRTNKVYSLYFNKNVDVTFFISNVTSFYTSVSNVNLCRSIIRNVNDKLGFKLKQTNCLQQLITEPKFSTNFTSI